jgi:hypothetical protein
VKESLPQFAYELQFCRINSRQSTSQFACLGTSETPHSQVGGQSKTSGGCNPISFGARKPALRLTRNRNSNDRSSFPYVLGSTFKSVFHIQGQAVHFACDPFRTGTLNITCQVPMQCSLHPTVRRVSTFRKSATQPLQSALHPAPTIDIRRQELHRTNPSFSQDRLPPQSAVQAERKEHGKSRFSVEG